MAPHFQHLTEFSFLWGYGDLSGKFLNSLADHCTNLRVLKLGGDFCRFLLDDTIIKLAACNRFLKKIYLFGCREITEFSMQAFAQYPEIDHEFCASLSLNLDRNCPALQVVKFHECPKITSIDSILTQCQFLRKISLFHCFTLQVNFLSICIFRQQYLRFLELDRCDFEKGELQEPTFWRYLIHH
jgi:hypothetical protein